MDELEKTISAILENKRVAAMGSDEFISQLTVSELKRDIIAAVKEQMKELEEFKYMYEGLCK